MNRNSQRGIALVTTLIMLSVVVLMAVAFLAVSRRERSSVAVTQDQTTAKLMADAALARAQAEIASRILAQTNLANFDFFVSTNFINPRGFRSGLADPTNVSYVYANGTLLNNQNDLLRNLANLQYDPRPPVFVATNDPIRKTTANDFRFFLDFNRNGFFEANGPVRARDGNFRFLGSEQRGITNILVGDPEWIGMPERPDLPHSGSNLFIGRYAFLVFPAGRSLDLNFMHNQAKRLDADRDGFFRNQGVGSWELNLAAFLRDLNTNIWQPTYYQYITNNFSSTGFAFEDATALLTNRYNGHYKFLTNANGYFTATLANRISTNIDLYADGFRHRQQTGLNEPWSGSYNTNAYFDLQELFALGKLRRDGVSNFVQRLQMASATNSTEDRYTLYRMLSQLGTDSVPAAQGKLNINFTNVDSQGNIAPSLVANLGHWQPLQFFTNAAERLLRTHAQKVLLQSSGANQAILNAYLNLSVTNIPIWPTNLLTGEVHRQLQLAANIYDATSIRKAGSKPGDPDFPSVFYPIFSSFNGNEVHISGWKEANDIAFLNRPWYDLENPAHLLILSNGQNVEANLQGVPIVIGAKKGWPNFNEFALQSSVQITRKLELVKANVRQRPVATNQLYLMGVSNLFGVEAWNSYSNTYARAMELRVTNHFTIILTNASRVAMPPSLREIYSRSFIEGTNIVYPANNWTSNAFKLPLLTSHVVLSNSAYLATPRPHFVPYDTNRANQFQIVTTNVPQIGLAISNRLQFILIARDQAGISRVVDFVNLNNIGNGFDVTEALIGNQSAGGISQDAQFWDPKPFRGAPQGVLNQILASMGELNADWNSFNFQRDAGQDKEKAIDKFKQFMLYPGAATTNLSVLGLRMQVPFTPTRKLFLNTSWQANDPLVHHTMESLTDPFRSNLVQVVRPQNVPTNSNLGILNERYDPWGGNPNKTASSDPYAFNLAVKDPGVRRSDDWDFPTNKFPNLGTLGRVHRGTPWQTIYLKSLAEPVLSWSQWPGVDPFGLKHPTNDWKVIDLFTTALNDTAARGLLSVNQTNLAAWSAALSGVCVLSNSIDNMVIRPNSVPQFTEWIIQPRSDQLLRIVDDINRTRNERLQDGRPRFADGRFGSVGDILAVPSLTTNSPYLNLSPRQLESGLTDAAVEALPRQILSLLKTDDPRFVIYAYGQTLQPAQNSRYLAPGPYYQICTNYQVTGEFVTRAVVRVEPQLVLPNDPAVVRNLLENPYLGWRQKLELYKNLRTQLRNLPNLQGRNLPERRPELQVIVESFNPLASE